MLAPRLLIAGSLLLGACSRKGLTAGLEPAPAGAPVIALSTTSADFTAPARFTAPMQMIAISNSGTGTLGGLGIDTVQYLDDSSGWLTVSLSSGTAPGALALQAAAGNLLPSTYYAKVKVSATGATNTPRSINVSFRVDPVAVGPIIGLSAVAAAFSAPIGGAVPVQAIQILPASHAELTGVSIADVTYGPNGSGWLSATLDRTSAPATLTLAPDPAGLSQGSYTALLTIAAPSAINSPRTVRVTLTVTTAPQPPSLRLSTTAVSFSGSAASSPVPQTIGITNGGGGSLDGLIAGPVVYGGAGTGWLGTMLSSASAPATLTLIASIGGLTPGTYTASVPVGAAGAGGSPSVAVTLHVAAGPAAPSLLSLAPTGLIFAAQAGASSPAAKTVSITNVGGGTLSGLAIGTILYGAGGGGWLTASLGSSVAPAVLFVTASPVALAAGTYTAIIPVSAPGARNSPQNVAVTFTVSTTPPPPPPPHPPPPLPLPPPPPPVPSLAIAPTSLAFSATVGSASPAARTATVSNAGGGSLVGLAVGTITYGAGGSGWVTASLGSSSAPAGLTIAPIPGGLAAGTYTATIPVTARGAANSPQSVTVTLIVSPAGGAVSFATDLYPTFQANCLSGGCHVPGQEKPNLSTLSAAYVNLVTATNRYVTAGNPNTGLLLGVLQGTTGPQMPPSGALSPAFIAKVKAWIQQGAPNN